MEETKVLNTSAENKKHWLNHFYDHAMIASSILLLTGCESGSGADSTAETEIESTLPLESQSVTEEVASSDEIETAGEAESQPVPEVPQLPGTGERLRDFVPEGWVLLDSVELDYNEDGVTDHVGVLETGEGLPRILFAVASDGTDGYRLDFQNINLIPTSVEGGAYGDPYQPLTAEGTSFTTCSYGGSAWRWTDRYTYTYRGGEWWLTALEETYGYLDYTTSYREDDWNSGVSVRKERSVGEWEKFNENTDQREYDVTYEMKLDEPLTLEQAGWRSVAASNRVTDWEVADMTFGPEVALSEELVVLPDEAYIYYSDEDCALYTFSDEDNVFYYLAMYSRKDKVLSILAKEDAEIDVYNMAYYKGKIYYAVDIQGDVTCSTVQDGEEQIARQQENTGVRLCRVGSDGLGKETLYEYRYPKAGQEVLEGTIPYIDLQYEISGDEIVVKMSGEGDFLVFYRMNTDGSGIREIGRMPKEV